MIASLSEKAARATKEAMSTSQNTSWWQQRTKARGVVVDLKDVKKGERG